MKKIKMISVFILGLFLFGCPVDKEGIDRTLTLVNDSEFDIYFHWKVNNEYPADYLYESIPSGNFLIKSASSKNIPVNSEWFVETLRIFVYKSSTLEANDWETVRDNGLYDARFDLTKEEIIDMNWTIVYDGL